MKKILAVYVSCLMIAFCMVGVFAYASSDSVTLSKSATVDAKSAVVGYSFDATATAHNDASSSATMTMAIWGSYKGALWPYTKEQTTVVSWGKDGSLYDTQDQTSSYYLVLTPKYYNGYVSGTGKIYI